MRSQLTVGLLLAFGLALGHTGVARAGTQPSASPVTLAEDATSVTLANGVISTRIDKRTGSFSLQYRGQMVIERGYWSQVGRASTGDIGSLGTQRSTMVRLDPAANGGARAEVACRFGYDGHSRGLPCDVELRFALGRGESGLYTYGLWEHKPGYPAFSVGEARTAYKLNPKLFDYLAVDADRHGLLPSGADWDAGETLNMKEVRRIRTGPLTGRIEHKYDYSAILADTPAYGWCGTQSHLGVWLVNPSIEYLAGGPTKVELTGHLDVNPGGAPTLLNMWHGSHYGGSSLQVAEGEAWSKVIGPFQLYCNGGQPPEALQQDALSHAAQERKQWPYAWVSDPAYPLTSARGSVQGRLTVSDPQAPALTVRNLQVGLAAAPYSDGGRTVVDWQRDSKHYQFWTRADADGRFRLTGVRPGSYTLYAFADGVLGEYRRADVTVKAGDPLDLGELAWKPERSGRQRWEIGVPDRTAREFRHGDHYWQWGLYYDYAKEFPHDVEFTIGKSDARRDWNYCQPPRIEGTRVSSTTWTVRWEMPSVPKGTATLRLAFAGSRGRHGVNVAVNGQPAGGTGPLPDTGVMHRDGIRGYWFERSVRFPATLLKQGTNQLTLTVPADSWVDGVLYDYLRLELAPE